MKIIASLTVACKWQYWSHDVPRVVIFTFFVLPNIAVWLHRSLISFCKDDHWFLSMKICKAFDVIDHQILGNDDSCLNWNNHISSTAWRIYPKLKFLNRISSFLSHKILLNIYKQTVLPILHYGCVVCRHCGKRNAQRLEHLQNQAMQIILYTGNAYKVGFIVSHLRILSFLLVVNIVFWTFG